MRALVIGQGSIGQRHTAILRATGAQVATVSAKAGRAYRSVANVPDLAAYDYAVVASSTSQHDAHLKALLDAGFTGRVLVEKPVFASSAPQIDVARFRKLRVGYNLRLHPVVEALRDAVRQVDVVAVRMHVGQSLPTWRPGGDFRTQSSARSDLGGGVLRDVSHEIDLLAVLFNGWTRLTAAPAAPPLLGISTEESAAVLFQLNSGAIVSLTLNYHDDPPERRYVVTTSAGTFDANVIAGTLRTPTDNYVLKSERNATYERQHNLMFDDGEAVLCDYASAVGVVKTIEAIERASKAGSWVDNG